MKTTYSKHNPYIKYYLQGRRAGAQRDDYCPHMCGSHEASWWWYGYEDEIFGW